jgi:hypothetical protein
MASTTMSSTVFDAEFLRQDLRSESTLPLLNFCLQLGPDATTKQATDKLHEITAKIGVTERPLPDESEQLQTALLKLMADGAPKVTTKPTVRDLESIQVTLTDNA